MERSLQSYLSEAILSVNNLSRFDHSESNPNTMTPSFVVYQDDQDDEASDPVKSENKPNLDNKQNDVLLADSMRSQSDSNFISYLDESVQDNVDGDNVKVEETETKDVAVLRTRKGRSNVATFRPFFERKTSLPEDSRPFDSSLRRSQSSREVRPTTKNRMLMSNYYDVITEQDEETGLQNSSLKSNFLRSFGGGLKRTLTMSSMMLNWNKSFRQRLHERTQSFRNLQKRRLFFCLFISYQLKT